MTKRICALCTAVILMCVSGVPLRAYATDADITDDEILTEEYEFSGSKNCGDDDGFTNPQQIEEGDNHYGWELGHFDVSGYTRVEDRESDNPIFLKNVGDTVKLTFTLEQDIDQLNGNEKLSINNDKKAYDEYFEIEKTSFGKGALIIRYTDYENKTGEPQIYTNYLKGVEVGAETEVELCEEGDYEIALDYSICSETFGDLWKIPISKVAAFEDDYQISFKFSVRNGNCMVYPFDVSTGEELTNTAFTENGFKLDFAKSRYLNIDITKQVLNTGKDGLTEDTRFNKPAKDGEEFTDEGIYTITVSNVYTDRKTEKIIYVGSNSVLQAYVTNQSYTVADINNLVDEGATINDDGTISMPVTTELITETETVTEATLSESMGETVTTESAITSNVLDSNSTIEKDSMNIILLIVIGSGVILIILVGVVIGSTASKKKGRK